MSRYLKIDLNNLDPIRIADDRTSQHGQTDTLRYIPGSALRGYVMSELAKKKELFERWKPAFFNGQIRFFHAYLTVDGKELIPSLKGFYEDKTACTGKKKIQNVIKQDVDPGFKRASLGSYCYIDGDCICYTGVELSEDININNGRAVKKTRPNEDNRNIYRSQYICKGQQFTGYVALCGEVDPELASAVENLLNGSVRIGNRRSGGYGTCQAECHELTKAIPYASVRTQKDGKEFYLVLLSNLVMRSETGELCGLNLKELAECLGCEKLELKRCATSTVQVYGYNRIWHGTIPSANMYEAGSVFCLEADREIPEEAFRRVEEMGLGIRTAEGFGQVAFLADLDHITHKQPMEQEKQIKDKKITETPANSKKHAKEDCYLAARGLLQHRIERGMERYIVEHVDELRGISSSQLGVIASMGILWQYKPEKAEQKLGSFVEHSKEKTEHYKKQDQKKKPDSFHHYLDKIRGFELYELLGISKEPIMGIPVEQLLDWNEQVRYKLQLMERQIRYANREGRSHG